MITGSGRVGVVTLVLVLAAACGSDGGAPSPTSRASAASIQGADFPIATFSAISEDPVPDAVAAQFQAALAQHDVADGGGMSATVMTAEGTWRGTTGKADGVRDLQVDDQFSIASITKSVVAAQVMLMVEAGELGLDDLVAEHLPEDLEFDSNEATVRHLLSHRSGLPDYYEVGPLAEIESDSQRAWTTTEVLDLVPTYRTPPGGRFSYSETNYLLLKVAIEHRRGRPLADVLRDGALAIDGLERLVHQPVERPSEPVAMPAGEARADWGGYLPSLAFASAYNASGGIASDSVSLARWWRAFCAGEIVSQASLTEMSALEPVAHLGSYGLGLSDPSRGDGPAFGHTGQLPGYMTWAACLPEDKAVIVVLTNHEVDDGHLAFSHGLARPLLDALRAR